MLAYLDRKLLRNPARQHTLKRYVEPIEYKMIEDLDKKISDGIFRETIYKFRLGNDEPNDRIIRERTIRPVRPKEMLANYTEAYLPIDETMLTESNWQNFALYTAYQMFPKKHISCQKMVANQLGRTFKVTSILQ